MAVKAMNKLCNFTSKVFKNSLKQKSVWSYFKKTLNYNQSLIILYYIHVHTNTTTEDTNPFQNKNYRQKTKTTATEE
jgi:hypothetical protein